MTALFSCSVFRRGSEVQIASFILLLSNILVLFQPSMLLTGHRWVIPAFWDTPECFVVVVSDAWSDCDCKPVILVLVVELY